MQKEEIGEHPCQCDESHTQRGFLKWIPIAEGTVRSPLWGEVSGIPHWDIPFRDLFEGDPSWLMGYCNDESVKYSLSIGVEYYIMLRNVPFKFK